MSQNEKRYISFGYGLWDKRIETLLSILQPKAKHILFGINRNSENAKAFQKKYPQKRPVFFHKNSPAFICELYHYWKQPTEELCFDWYLSEESPEELIFLSDDYLLTDDLTDIQNAVMSVSVVEYGGFAVCVRDYQGVFASMLGQLSDLFEGPDQFTEYRQEFIRFI